MAYSKSSSHHLHLLREMAVQLAVSYYSTGQPSQGSWGGGRDDLDISLVGYGLASTTHIGKAYMICDSAVSNHTTGEGDVNILNQ